MKRPKGHWFLLAALIASAGCSRLTGGQPAFSTPLPVTVQQNITFGAGPFNLPDARTGLSDLDSYTATLTVSFDGMQGGQPSKWSRRYVMQASKHPAVRQWNIDTTTVAAGTDSEYLAEVEGADYTARGADTCSASAIQHGQGFGDTLEPAGFLHFVVGAQPSGAQNVNGLPADHYRFDEHALGQENLTQSTGEFWIASAGGYVLKYLLTSRAGEDYFGAGRAGTVTWDYQLTSVGKPLTLKLPPDCPGGMINAPLLPNPSDEVNTPGLLSYQTATGLTDAAAFYEKQIPDLGWTAAMQPDMSDTKVSLLFRQANETMTIVLNNGSGRTSVTIVLVRTPK